MGKTIIQQARGHGSLTYRVRKQAYKYRLAYADVNGKGRIIKLINSSGHSAPIAKVMVNNKIFFIPAAEKMYEGKEIEIGNKFEEGNVMTIKDIPVGARIFNIELRPGDGGKLVKTAGSFAVVTKKAGQDAMVLLPSRKEVLFSGKCRATIGRISGDGRLTKPILKAGKMHYMMKSRNKFWPRTSAVKFNAVDHPFGSGRGKRIKSKIAKRNAPPGAKVGTLRPRRTGRRKR